MRRFVVGTTVLLLLAGCGGDPKADPSPSTSPTPSASSTPTPSAPAMPDAAKANTKAGATAFVRHYIDLINYAQQSGDVRALAAVEAPACGSCKSGRSYITDVYNAGGHIDGGDLSVKIYSALRNASIAGWTIDATLSYGPQTIIRPSATPTAEHLDGGGVPITVLVANRTGQWLISDWTRVQ
jgi:hypothetical protein